MLKTSINENVLNSLKHDFVNSAIRDEKYINKQSEKTTVFYVTISTNEHITCWDMLPGQALSKIIYYLIANLRKIEMFFKREKSSSLKQILVIVIQAGLFHLSGLNFSSLTPLYSYALTFSLFCLSSR